MTNILFLYSIYYVPLNIDFFLKMQSINKEDFTYITYPQKALLKH